jgi:thioredoxin 1
MRASLESLGSCIMASPTIPKGGESKMIELTKDNFDAEVKESALPCLSISGARMRPCMALLPNVHKMAEEYEGKVKFSSVNVSENRRVAIAQKVMGFRPFFSGREVSRSPGSAVRMYLEKIRENVEALL